MASLSRDKNGSKRILFSDGNGTRQTIRLGKVPVKAAESFLARVERLIAFLRTGTAIDGQTAHWLADLPDDIHARLVWVGLVDDREAEHTHSLGVLLREYFKTISVKDSTRTRYEQTRRLLIEHFGGETDLRNIGPREADRWRSWLADSGFADATVSKNVTIARMLFKQGLRWGWIPSNPLEGVRAGSQTNRARLYYLTPDDAQRLLEAAPNADWRCIIVLARYGGLRCPSEVLGIRWADVDWATNRLRVRSPKTEGHGKAERVVPLFPELRVALMDSFDLATDGAEFVISMYRDTTSNLRTQLMRIIDRAGLEPWPRLFNAMRASRATELAAGYPAAVCTAWMGHTQAVAEAHYHMVRDSDFERASSTPTPGGAECGALAAQNAAQHLTASVRTKPQEGSEVHAETTHTRSHANVRETMRNEVMGATGLEPVTSAM
jgi:integrase